MNKQEQALKIIKEYRLNELKLLYMNYQLIQLTWKLYENGYRNYLETHIILLSNTLIVWNLLYYIRLNLVNKLKELKNE